LCNVCVSRYRTADTAVHIYRTVLISFGFDEEIGGVEGADHLSAEILKRYGPDSISLLVDEGFGGVDETYGAKVASLGMAEKGAVNFKVIVEWVFWKTSACAGWM
jgi:acetylornithine deacetylase/succinyl-diaminopimelate desuccinylase-like protein